MKKPLPLIVKQNGKLVLNEEVLSIIQSANNPAFISLLGSTRIGKSTTLNQLIASDTESSSYIREEPFKTSNSIASVTSGCDIYGPIKCSDLVKKHKAYLSFINSKEDFDIFFCDTEGIGTLNEIHKSVIPGILIILQICTLSVFMVQTKCDEQNLKVIASLMQFAKILNKDFKLYPKIGVYISDMLSGSDEDNEDDLELDFSDKKILKDIYLEHYIESKQILKEVILNRAQRKYPNLDFKNDDFEIIAGGPYFPNDHPKEDRNLFYYWCSIHQIIDTFLTFYRKKRKEENNEENNIDIIKLIRTLFEIFCEIDKIDDDFDLRTFLITYLGKKFDDYSNKQFDLKLKKIKENIQANFNEYIEILNNDEKVKSILDDCFDKNLIQIYNKLIPEKIQSFKELSVKQYRKYIKEQIDIKFESICKNILSKENIETIIQNVKEKIIKAEFKEDIDMNQINNIETFWENIYEKNKMVLNYFKENKKNLLNNLKTNFTSEINKIFQNLLSSKNLWSNYLKNILVSTQKEVNKYYLEMLKKCNYQEDIEIYIQKSTNLFNSIFPSIKEKNFNSLSEVRLNEAKEKIQKICDIEFNKEYIQIIKNKLPNWKNIKEDISSRIKENIEAYLAKIFKGVEFRDQVEPNLGRKEAIENIIPLTVKENSQVKGNKKDVIYDLINLEINNAVKLFNEKRENLPLFNEFADNLIKISDEIADNKMKEIINSFYYLEDKIVFNSDYIFSLLTGDQKIYENCSSKIKEINIKLRELCDNKSKEYEVLIQKIKPKWEKIKSDKISIINDICSEYIKKVISNADFQEDIKDINKDELKKIIIESKGFYDGIRDEKKNEINSEIDKNISKTEDIINAKKGTLESWNSAKTQLLYKAYIEMSNKFKSNLSTKDSSKLIELLLSHIDTIPKFYDLCKTEQRKSLQNRTKKIRTNI